MPAAIVTGFAHAPPRPRFAACTVAGGLPNAALLAFPLPPALLATAADRLRLRLPLPVAEGIRVRYGIHTPDLAVLRELLFRPLRGLFPSYRCCSTRRAWGCSSDDLTWPTGHV
ncbi:hypothetical protein [Nannocystis sp.]|uniref:hypothetical protein n=1 Tax=Nannocystis sp. TaxID=1962667 RepID=UPI0025FE7AC1|nr:hypothetical protein [Nannocystis sp.]MBK7826514.1 hypothetical protein [Nannocystis sp.]